MLVDGSRARVALKHKRSHVFGKDQIGLAIGRLKRSTGTRWRN